METSASIGASATLPWQRVLSSHDITPSFRRCARKQGGGSLTRFGLRDNCSGPGTCRNTSRQVPEAPARTVRTSWGTRNGRLLIGRPKWWRRTGARRRRSGRESMNMRGTLSGMLEKGSPPRSSCVNRCDVADEPGQLQDGGGLSVRAPAEMLLAVFVDGVRVPKQTRSCRVA